MNTEINCQSCKYYKDEYCENLEVKPCYPQKGCEYFSKVEQEPIYYPPCEDCHKKMNEIRKAYDKIQSAEPIWIPVSERLPQEREWYLSVFMEKDTGFQLIPRVADYIGNGKWRIIDEDGLVQEYRDILECIAWMPLPKPFEPQESEVSE